LYTALVTRSNADSGTGNDLALVINQNGVDHLHSTLPPNGETPQEDLKTGQANLYRLNVLANGITPEQLTNQSIRMIIKGDDEWRPEHMFVWGERAESPSIVPLAAAVDITTRLSTDDEGHGAVSSLPLSLVKVGGVDTPINRLLVAMETANVENAGTENRIELTMANHQGLHVVAHRFNDTSQLDQDRGEANVHVIPALSTFRKVDIDPASVRLRIKGGDAWRPAKFFVFGIDTREGRPQVMVPLVHRDPWGSQVLSTDLGEGHAFVTLPLV
jgi:hypothetical protein